MRRVSPLATLVAVVLLAGSAEADPAAAPERPAEMPYTVGERVPEGYRIELRHPTPTIAVGAGVALGAYGASLTFAIRDDDERSRVGAIPVLGALALGAPGGVNDAVWIPWLLDSFAQIGGIIAVVSGGTTTERVLVRDADVRPARPRWTRPDVLVAARGGAVRWRF